MVEDAAGIRGSMRTRLGWPAEHPLRDREPRRRALGWPVRRSGRHADDPSPEPVTASPSDPVSRESSPAPTPPTAAEVADSAAEAVRSQDQDAPPAVASEPEVRLVQTRPRPAPLQRPDRTRTFVVANQKGGVGKTTTAVNVAAALAQAGQRVLLVDLDPQGNASTALAIEHGEGTPGAYQALIKDQPLTELVQEAPELPGLSVLPAAIDLAGAEIDLVSLVARESRLRRALSAYVAARAAEGVPLDYVFIDCPPSLGLLTVNALVAGEEILIPLQCEYYALEGVGQLLRTVDMVRAHLNPALQVSTILLTMHDARTRLSAGVADEVRRHFPDQVLRTAIPRSVRISEAPSYQQTVMTYDPSSPGALSYLEAAREISTRGALAPAGSAADGSAAHPPQPREAAAVGTGGSA